MKKNFLHFFPIFKLIWKTKTKVFLVFIFFAFSALPGLVAGFVPGKEKVAFSVSGESGVSDDDDDDDEKTARTTWIKIQNNYLDDIKKFNIIWVEEVGILYLLSFASKNTNYESLSDGIKTELKNLVAVPTWETTLKDLILTAKAKVIWNKLKTNYLNDIKRFLISKIGEVVISDIKRIEDKNTAYESLSNEIKTELKNLVAFLVWETTLEGLILTGKANIAWITIGYLYLNDLKSLGIKSLAGKNLTNTVNQNTSDKFGSLDENVKEELKDLVSDEQWKGKLIDLIAETKAKNVWNKLKTTYLNDIQRFNIINIREVDIPNIKRIKDKNTAYNDLSDEIKAELENLTSFLWETILQNLIKKVKAEVVKTAWDKFKTTYLNDIQNFNISKIGEVDIPNLESSANKDTAYESLSNEIKTELENLVFNEGWETTLEGLIESKPGGKERVAWKVIKTNYLDDIQRFNITKIGEVDIFNIRKIKNKNTAYNDLTDKIKVELSSLVFNEGWERTLQNLIVTGKAETTWVRIQNDYLDYIQRFNIKKVGKIDISNIKGIKNKNTTYDNLSNEIKAELKTLIAVSTWKTTLLNLINESDTQSNVWKIIKTYFLDGLKNLGIKSLAGKDLTNTVKQNTSDEFGSLDEKTKQELKDLASKEWKGKLTALIAKMKAKNAWDKLKTTYLADIKKFNIKKVGEIDISDSHIREVENKNTAYESLSDEIKAELKTLVADKDWESDLQKLIKNKQAEVAWKFLQDKIAILKADKNITIVAKKIDLILKQDKNTDYVNLEPAVQNQLKDLITLNDYQKKINAVIQKDEKDEKDFPLAVVLVATIPAVLLIILVVSYFIVKKKLKNKN